MEQDKLWYDKKNGEYYLEKDDISCTNCHNDISNVALMMLFWHKKKSWISYFCTECYNKMADKSISMVQEKRFVILRKPPKTAMPIIIRPPQLTNSRDQISVFEAAELKSDRTMDKTVYSNKYPSIEGATIGKEIDESVGCKDELISIKEIDELLLDIKTAEKDKFNTKRIEKK